MYLCPATPLKPAVAMNRHAGYRPLKTIREPFRVVGRGLALPPEIGVFYGIEDPRGYEALTLDQFVTTWKLWCRRHGIWFNRVDDLTRPFLSFMNVRFAIQAAGAPICGTDRSSSGRRCRRSPTAPRTCW